MVGELEEVEALGDREQATRLRSGVPVIRDVSAVHDPSQQLERRLVEPVLLEQDLERAEAVTVVESRPRASNESAALALGDVQHVRQPGRSGTLRRDR